MAVKATKASDQKNLSAAEFIKLQKTKKSRKSTSTNTSALTNSVIDRINFTEGCMARRINNGGVFDPVKKIFRKPKAGTAGTSDIIACIFGLFVGIEIKTGKDFQSDAQIDFEKQVRKAKGTYIIVSDINHFENWFQQFLKK